MSAEQVGERVSAPVSETPRPDVDASLSNLLLEKRLARRTKEILDRIQRSEESQRVT